MSDTKTANTGAHKHEAKVETKANPSAVILPVGTMSAEIAGLELDLPRKFAPGMVLTDAQARILDAAYQRQYANNMNATAKARADKLAKAKTDAERAAAAPLTPEQLLSGWTDYEPNVGRLDTASTMERLRSMAALAFWTDRIAAHNKAVDTGGEPVIVKAGRNKVTLVSVKGTDGKMDKERTEEARNAFAETLLKHPDYGALIQPWIDRAIAERDAKREARKAETSKVETVEATASLL